MLLEKGRICIVKKGRDFGKIAMIVSSPDKNKVEIEGPKLKRRKINIMHLWFLNKTLNVKDVKNLKNLLKI